MVNEERYIIPDAHVYSVHKQRLSDFKDALARLEELQPEAEIDIIRVAKRKQHLSRMIDIVTEQLLEYETGARASLGL